MSNNINPPPKSYLESFQGSEDLLSVLSDLTSITERQIREPKYVVHTSTIPLSTTFDKGVFENNATEHQHCFCENCMYDDSSGNRHMNYIHKHCPCLEHTSEEMCFLTFLQCLGKNLRHSDCKTNPEEFCFCPDSDIITGDRYPKHIRDKSQVSSWYDLEIGNFHSVFLGLYWYRKYHTKYNFITKIRKLLILPEGKTELKQILFTIDGVLCKQFLVFPDFVDSYSDIAKSTAGLFNHLLKDYSSNDGDKTHFMVLKEYFDHVKQSFASENMLTRLQIFNRSMEIDFLLGNPLRRFESWLEDHNDDYDGDYTLTLGWITRMTILSQTRNMGYIPYCESLKKMNEYIAVISTEAEIPDRQLKDVSRILTNALQEIPDQTMSLFDGEISEENKEIQKLFDQVVTTSEFTLKNTASFSQTRERGGKLEDARLIILSLIQNNVQIPVRNLFTGNIESFFDSSVLSETKEIDEALFWFSLQTVLNVLVKENLLDKTFQYHLPKVDKGPLEEQLFLCRLVKIREPGKDRFLIKSSSILTWILTPVAKQTQGIIASIPEHTEGLTGSAHAWKHYERICPGSSESSFMYTADTRIRKDNITNFYTDWTKATDYIPKKIGLVLMMTFFKKIGYPDFYKEIILLLLNYNLKIIYPVECNRRTLFEERIVVRRGFMMGLPLTKTILHLMQVVVLHMARVYQGHKSCTHLCKTASMFNFVLDRRKTQSTEVHSTK